MSVKQFAADMRAIIVGAKSRGIVTIPCDTIIAHLDRVLESPYAEPPAVEIERYKAMLQTQIIDASRSEHQSELEMFRSVITSGQAAMKSSLLLNGGAAVALLAFIAHLAQHSPAKVSVFAECLLFFALGALAIVVTSGITYLSQWLYADPSPTSQKYGFRLNIICIVLGILSYGFFAWGLFATYGAFVDYN